MFVTVAELKNDVAKYVALSRTRDIYITDNGRDIARLTASKPDELALLDSLVGIISDKTISLDDARDERLQRQ